MMAANALSAGEWDEIITTLSFMDAKTGIAFMRLCAYLRRFGSVPSAERALASILNLTVGYLRNRAWPLLEPWLELSDDQRRYFIPEITGVRSKRAQEPVPQEKSTRFQELAKKRWHGRMPEDAAPHNSPHENDAEIDAIQATNAASAASSPASPRTHELSLSKEDSVDQPIEKERVLERESLRASAGETASGDAAAHAAAHTNDASADAAAHAKSDAAAHAKTTRPILPSVRPISPDWMPNAGTLAEGLQIRADAEAQVKKFIRWNSGKGHTAADWNPLFLRFLEHANAYERRNPQASIPIIIPGGKTEAAAGAESEPEEPIIGNGPEAHWARAMRQFKAEIGSKVYLTWMSQAAFVGLEDGEGTISLPSVFVRDYVRNNYTVRLAALWRAQDAEVARVAFVVAASERRKADG